MKRPLRKSLSGVLAVAMISAGLLVFTAGNALAVTPPWEPDPNSATPYGNVVFYNAAGNVITSGNDLSHIADYFVATSGPDTGANKATLYFAAPDHTKVTSLWATNQQSASTTFPNAAAPAPINGFTRPVVTTPAGAACLSCALGGFVLDSTAGYANMIQVRVVDSGAGGAGSGTNYWSTDISYNAANNSWAQVFPEVVGPTPTTTSITTTPANGGNALSGTNVTMTATVAPAASANGTVQFMDDFPAVHNVGAAQPVTTGSPTTAVVTDTAPPDGVHHYTAVFTPTDPSTVGGSTSPQSTVTIHPPQTGTSTSLLASPTTAAQGAPVTLTANVTPTAAAPGSMQFFDGAASLGTQTTDDGTVGEYVLVVSSLGVGTHANIHATFTPTNTSFAASTSPDVTVTITPAASCTLPGSVCTDPQNITVDVSAGSLTISTPYTPETPFVLPAMQLDPTGTFLQSSALFPATADPQIVVTSTLAGNPTWTVSVSGTDLTNGGNTIDGMGLGLTGGGLHATPAFPYVVNFTDNPAHNPTLSDGFVGIKGGPFTFAHSVGGGIGTASMQGTLTLLAPTSTPAGTYTGTITFSVA